MKTVAASVLQQHIDAVLASSRTTISQQKQVDGCADTSDDDGSDVSDDKSDNEEDDDENLQVKFYANYEIFLFINLIDRYTMYDN